MCYYCALIMTGTERQFGIRSHKRKYILLSYQKLPRVPKLAVQLCKNDQEQQYITI